MERQPQPRHALRNLTHAVTHDPCLANRRAPCALACQVLADPLHPETCTRRPSIDPLGLHLFQLAALEAVDARLGDLVVATAEGPVPHVVSVAQHELDAGERNCGPRRRRK